MDNPEHLLPSDPHQTVILLVDDEPMIRNVARITLEAEGYFILTASDGNEAMFISGKFPGTIHALLSDIRMPKMDGLELRKRIQEERPSIKVLLMSGHVIDPPIAGVLFLQKPFGPAVLKERMRRLLGSTGSASSAGRSASL